MSSRRDFLKFSGSVSLLPALPALGALAGAEALAATPSGKSATPGGKRARAMGRGAPGVRGAEAFEPLGYGTEDELSVAKGFAWYPITSTGEVINAKGDRFGDCCDFSAPFAGENADHCFLWVNHEYFVPNLVHGRAVKVEEKTRAMVEAEMKLVGGSLLELRRSKAGKDAGRWKVVADSKRAFRVDANTDIPLVGPAGGRTVKGTMGNCGGGLTPWRTALSGEENVEYYYTKDGYGWGRFFERSATDYGWIVEIDVDTGASRKLTALGRFAHEGATVTLAKDGRVAVYMGDDAAGRCLYKFLSKGKLTGDRARDKDLLVEGDLYVADLKGGKWHLLAPSNEKLAADKEGRFKTLEAIVVDAREAAKVAGGTPLNRPEDVKIHPKDGTVYFTLTNNAAVGDFHGQVVMLEEEGGDAGATSFVYDTYIAGGARHGFSCPDNLVFGPKGSLWVCTDISGTSMGKGTHKPFARNSMVRVEVDASGITHARHFLQSPHEAEITGPSFSLDGKTLFLSIQHPGEESFENGAGLTSHWPDGGAAAPRSTLIGVEGKGGRFS